jgi:hypothetical protein
MLCLFSVHRNGLQNLIKLGTFRNWCWYIPFSFFVFKFWLMCDIDCYALDEIPFKYMFFKRKYCNTEKCGMEFHINGVLGFLSLINLLL